MKEAGAGGAVQVVDLNDSDVDIAALGEQVSDAVHKVLADGLMPKKESARSQALALRRGYGIHRGPRGGG